MAVRQYIGARYVPKYFNNSSTGDPTWASNTAYEPLTIVLWNDSWYTSKVEVPTSIGAPNLNSDYWVLTGARNANIGVLAERVDDLETDVGTLQGNVTNINGAISDINDDIGDINDAVDALEEEVANIKTGGQYIVVFGDSWSDSVHDQNVEVHILANKLGLTLKNYSYGGTGFDVENGYNDQLDNFINDGSYDHSEVKYVVLIAGLNEYHNITSTEFATKLNAFAGRVHGAVDCPFYWFHNYSLENDMSQKTRSTKYYLQFEYYDAIVRSIGSDIHTALTFGWVQAGNWNTNNYYHPNANGSNQYFSNVANVIMGCAPTIYEYDRFELYWSGSLAETWRRVYIEFYLMGYDLNACVRTTCAGAVSIPSSPTLLQTSRPLPCNVSPSLLVDGVVFSGTGGVPSLDVANAAAKAATTWTTGMGGYASIFAKGYK